MRRDIVKRRVGPALYEAMEPGDQDKFPAPWR